MIFLNKVKYPALAGLMLLVALFSCEDELTTVGSGVLGQEPFTTRKASFDVFAFNKKIAAVQTNRLPVYHLGVYNDAVYGKTEAQITSQLRLSTANPTFGSFRPEDEVLDAENATKLPEEETVTEVYLYIPFLTKTAAQRDSDSDGVDDAFDSEPNDPSNDSDGDTIPNNEENTGGTDPLLADTDGDGTPDNEDTDTARNVFPKRVDLDSIYGNREQGFNITVRRSEFFLRDRDPNTAFENQQEYFSSQEFSSFVSEVLYDKPSNPITISDREIVTFKDDDPDTSDVDESLELDERLAPGIRVLLDGDFFQENIIDKEGSSELLSQTNFTEFLRGINITLTPGDGEDELLLLLDIAQANITINYEYQKINNNNTPDDTADDEQTTEESSFVLNLLQIQGQAVNGNAVNTLVNDAYTPEIIAQFEEGLNASRIYLKGGSGSYAEIRLFDADGDETAEAITQIKANNWIINEANLVFYVDQEALGNGTAPDGESFREPVRLYLYDTETLEPLINFATENTITQDLFGSFLNYDGIIVKEAGRGVKYTVKITDHINDLVLRDEDNVVLGLTITSDISRTAALSAMVNDNDDGEENLPIVTSLSPLGTVLFGSNVSQANQANKLQLEIFYTEAN